MPEQASCDCFGLSVMQGVWGLRALGVPQGNHTSTLESIPCRGVQKPFTPEIYLPAALRLQGRK
jgi:hypothetical protein